MAKTITMPQLGESVVEGTVGTWLVKVGDHVNEGDPLVEIETDKANTEVPASGSGYIHELLVEEGETVEVGTELLRMGSEKPSGAQDNAAQEKPAKPAKQQEAADEPEAPAPTKPAAAPAKDAPPEAVLDGPRGGVPGGHTAAAKTSPAIVGGARQARNQAPAAKEASAPAARATQTVDSDLPYGAPEGAKFFRTPPAKAGAEDTVIKFSRRRAIIAEHMVYSKAVSPHVPTMAEVDMTNVMNHRRANKDRLREQGTNLTVFSYILAATAKALREFPGLNAVVGDGEIIQRGGVHIGIAVETDGGLVVPVIRNADSLSVAGLADAVSELAEKARDKKITVDDLSGGTFTVSNPGREGNLIGFAVINQPQVGIVRMGEIVRRPVVRKYNGEEAIVIRDIMYLSLSYDHRIVDGALGNSFLYRIGQLLTEGNFDI